MCGGECLPVGGWASVCIGPELEVCVDVCLRVGERVSACVCLCGCLSVSWDSVSGGLWLSACGWV